jgi:hypothetical protein
VQKWQHGSPAQDVIELINIFASAFDLLPVPTAYKVLANIIIAGITAVVGILTANSPASPAPATAHEESPAHSLVHLTMSTATKVQELAPGFKPRIFTAADKQYTDYWNKTVANGDFPETLKV